MSNQPHPIERRRDIRIKKSYIGRFTLKDNNAGKSETSQIENISQGGLSFNSRMLFKRGDILNIELHTPFIADKVYLEGVVLNVHEKIKDLIYQNHVKFQNITSAAAGILKAVENYNKGSEP